MAIDSAAAAIALKRTDILNTPEVEAEEIKPRWVRHLRRSLGVRSLNFSHGVLHVLATLRAISRRQSHIARVRRASANASLQHFLDCFCSDFSLSRKTEDEIEAVSSLHRAKAYEDETSDAQPDAMAAQPVPIWL
ncbi:hypothetical protein [Bradyrhizobium liaoningense]|uniref:hypothetical protein n=1 Tax=Bradyrhizobium liaoningense TaxID=43992 RepID=UPI001BA8C993|nr:hypothetical protein [Bradyrhizobium liaoningense]MBR0715053.1 hypothetical protein [Bradyrhizobium liaoningense]